MPKYKPNLSMTVDMSSLSKLGKKAKAAQYKALYSSILPSVESPNPSPTPTQSEEGSPMAVSSKTPTAKKTVEQLALDKFNAAMKKALDYAKGQINAELLRAVLRDRVRAELAAEYGPQMPVAELEKHANHAARQVAYELKDITVMPEGIQHVPVTNLELNPKHHVAEPTDMMDDDDL